MQAPALPADEVHRLAMLRAAHILDTQSEERFDRITRIAQYLFDVPIALVSLIDADRQWFKSCIGLDVRETPRSISFCGHAILGPEVFLVNNALEDPRFADNPLVTGPPHIRFYAGQPLKASDGSMLGTLCIIDNKPRQLSPDKLALLADLAATLERELNQQTLVEAMASAEASRLELNQSQQQLQNVLSSSPSVTYTLALEQGNVRATWVSHNIKRFLGFEAAETLAQAWWIEHVHPDDRSVAGTIISGLMEQGHSVCNYRMRNHAGQYIWVRDELQLLANEGGIQQVIGSWSDVTQQHESEMMLERTHGLLEAIRKAQSQHISQASPVVVFSELLAALLEFGESEYGFIGEVVSPKDGSPYLQTCAISNVAWGDASHDPAMDKAQENTSSTSLQPLFDAVRLKVEPVIINGPTADSADRDLAAGKLLFNSFLGMPIKAGDSMLGMVGIANRTGGYNDQVIKFLEPLLSTIGQLLESHRADVEHQKVRKMVERLSLVASKTTNGVIITDVEGRVEWVNEGFSRMTGYSLQEMLGRSPGAVLQGPESDPVAINRIREALQRTESCDVGLVNYTKSGRPYWVSISLDPLRDDNAQLLGFMAINTDITQRKKTETALAESVTHTQAILDNVIDGIVTLNELGLVASFNPAAERIFGYAADEVIGQTIMMLMPESGSAEHEGYLRNYQEPGTGIGRELEGQRKNGALFPMEWAVSAFSREGRPMYIGLVRDITERKKIERLKSEFVSTVSHELRTPLTSIRGSLGLVAGGVVGELLPQVKSLIDIAYKNSERLVGLINDLLDVEKIESGKMRFELAPVRLMNLLEQSVQANQAYAQQYDVRYEVVQKVADTVQVVVDEMRLMQVFSNLLSNAAKFSPANDVVEIAVTQNGGAVRVSVKDHGQGIPDAFRSSIFQKFSQADASDTRQKGGTGLGLSITKAIIEHMHGTIGFDSVEGAGATFWFELAEWNGQPARTEMTATSARQKTPKILVYENQPDVAKLLATMLQQAGYEPDIVQDAGQAQKMLASQCYAALALDIKLTDQSGTALIRALRADPAMAGLPIVVVFGNMDKGEAGFSGGFSVVDWLGQSTEQQRLVETLQSAIQGLNRKRAKILHVEDDADLRHVVAALTQDIADCDSVATVAEAANRLLIQRYDLVILDLGMPDQSGWHVLEYLKKYRPQPPVLVFSGQELTGEESERVASVLVKSHTSNSELLETILALVQPKERNHTLK